MNGDARKAFCDLGERNEHLDPLHFELEYLQQKNGKAPSAWASNTADLCAEDPTLCDPHATFPATKDGALASLSQKLGRRGLGNLGEVGERPTQWYLHSDEKDPRMVNTLASQLGNGVAFESMMGKHAALVTATPSAMAAASASAAWIKEMTPVPSFAKQGELQARVLAAHCGSNMCEALNVQLSNKVSNLPTALTIARLWEKAACGHSSCKVQVVGPARLRVAVNDRDGRLHLKDVEKLVEWLAAQVLTLQVSTTPVSELVTTPTSTMYPATQKPLDYDGNSHLYQLWNANTLTGQGQVVGVVDSSVNYNHCSFAAAEGATVPVEATSPDLTARKLVNTKYPTGAARDAWNRTESPGVHAKDHGTHVCGLIAADKITSTTQWLQNTASEGVAAGAKLAFIGVGTLANAGLPGLTACEQRTCALPWLALQTAKISSNSYGIPWNPNTLQHIMYSGYEGPATDAYMEENPEMLVLFAGGNSGYAGPMSVGPTGKNMLVVGAATPNKTLSYYSGVGPTPDLRMKPDLVGFGTGVMSADSRTQCSATDMTGTSMATPNVAGSAALIRDYLAQGYYPTGVATSANANTAPSATLIKSLLITSARPIAELETSQQDKIVFASAPCDGHQLSDTPNLGLGTVPSYHQGHGLVETYNTLLLRSSSDSTLPFGLSMWDNVNITAGEVISFVPNFVCPTGKSLRVSMVFNDVTITSGDMAALATALASTGATGVPPNLDIVANDLDLIVTQGDTTWYPNGRSGPDPRNTVEKVIAPCNGKPFTILVKATTLYSSSSSFALTVTSGELHSTPACTTDVCDILLPTPWPVSATCNYQNTVQTYLDWYRAAGLYYSAHALTLQSMPTWTVPGYMERFITYTYVNGTATSYAQRTPNVANMTKWAMDMGLCHWSSKTACMADSKCGWCEMPRSNCHNTTSCSAGRCYHTGAGPDPNVAAQSYANFLVNGQHIPNIANTTYPFLGAGTSKTYCEVGGGSWNGGTAGTVPAVPAATRTLYAASSSVGGVSIGQTATFTGLTAAQWTGNTAYSYEVGYGKALSIWDAANTAYYAECSIASTLPTATRRTSLAVQFNAVVAAARAAAANSAAGSLTAAALQTSINNAITELGNTATVPAAVVASVNTPTCSGTSCTASEDDELSGGVIAGIVFGSFALLLIVIIIVAVKFTYPAPAAASATGGVADATASAPAAAAKDFAAAPEMAAMERQCC
jgi:hypothetical protein